MDRIAHYRHTLETYLSEQAAVPFSPSVKLKLLVVFDRERNQYLLLTTGHHQGQRVHRADLHFSLLDGKVLLLEDNTDWDVLEELQARGIPNEDLIDARGLESLVVR